MTKKNKTQVLGALNQISIKTQLFHLYLCCLSPEESET